MISRATELKWVSAIGLALALVFVSFPGIDLAVSGLFFRDGHWLLEPESPWLVPIYRGLPRLGQALILALTLLWIASFIPRLTQLRAARLSFAFLLVGALLGPALLVDIVLKNHSGRARPINTQAFGGPKQFTPAFVPADQCRKNCSFISGHAAGVSFLMAFGWLAAPIVRRRWLLASVAACGVVGIARMLPGGHFLSDVIFPWFAVYFSLALTEWLFRRLRLLPAPSSDGDPHPVPRRTP